MLIAGAGGHSREIQFEWDFISKEDLVFFDDSGSASGPTVGFRKVLRSLDEARLVLLEQSDFIIGVGRPALRRLLSERLTSVGGGLRSLISANAYIGKRNVHLEEGLNIMTGAVVSADVFIGRGTLIHMYVSVHHDCTIGEFSEISPGVRLLGGVRVGREVSIGSGAVILPGISVGDHAVIGAGSVVTEDIPERTTVVGVPAKVIR